MVWPFIPLTDVGVSSGVNVEAHLFVYAALTGVFLIVVYDLLRIFRRVCPHGAFWIGIEDFFYWLFSAIVIFGVLLKENNGVFRWFFVVGMLLGMIIYYFCVGRYFVVIIAMIINKILDVVKKILRVLLKPFKKIVIFLVNRIKRQIKSIKGRIKIRQKNIEKKDKTMYNDNT